MGKADKNGGFLAPKSIANRIKAIERACGQHAVVKMKLFATILALEGYVELAEDAAAAHKRLVDKLGEPGEAAGADGVEKGKRTFCAQILSAPLFWPFPQPLRLSLGSV